MLIVPSPARAKDDPTGGSRRRRPAEILKEVQGLRAIAVSLVVIYHIWPTALPGGFLGVDVFFVISGFLISSHLLREVKSTGSVSLSRFWVRRIKRILPAAFVVLIASLAIMVFAIPRTVWAATLAQIEAASVYVVNWVLAAQSVDYLAANQPPTIVEHFWSLSLEEQFYIVWPVLLVTVIALARRLSRKSGLSPRATGLLVAAVAGVVTIASFCYSLYLTEWQPSLAYFNTFARAWEFCAGVLVASLVNLAPESFARLRDHRILGRSRLLSAIGLTLILVGAFTLNGDKLFPAPLGLVAVLGALLVIVGGYSSKWSVGSVLGIRPVQFAGDISYSAYLWHWPFVIWFTYAFAHAPSLRSGLLIVLATIAAAWISKIFIEDPARRSQLFALRRWPAYSFAAIGALVITVLVLSIGVVGAPKASQAAATPCSGAGALLSGSDCKNPFVLPANTDLAAASQDLDTKRWCLTWFNEDWRTCDDGDVSGTAHGTLALVGDSYAASFTVAMDDYFKQEGWKVETYTRFGCPGLGYPNPAVKPTTSDAQEYINCRKWSERVRKTLLSRSDISAVVFIGRTPTDPVTPDNAWSQLSAADIEKTWTTLSGAGKKIASVTTSPDLQEGNVPTCLTNHVGENAPCSRPRKDVVMTSSKNTAESALKGKVTAIDMTDAFCDASTCYAVVGGVVVYADERHVSGTYSKSVMRYLGPKLLAAFGDHS